MDKTLLFKGLINDKKDDNLTVGTVTSIVPLKVKIYSADDEINVVSTTGLYNLQIGSRVLMIRYGSQYVGIAVIGEAIPWTNYIVKPSSTSRSSTTTTTADPHLTLTLPKNGIYKVDVDLFIDGTADGQDFKCNFDSPNISQVAGAGMQALSTSSTSTSNGNFNTEYVGVGTERSSGVVASGWTYRSHTMILSTSSSDGTITLKWSQATSSTTAITLVGGSRIIATKIDSN